MSTNISGFLILSLFFVDSELEEVVAARTADLFSVEKGTVKIDLLAAFGAFYRKGIILFILVLVVVIVIFVELFKLAKIVIIDIIEIVKIIEAV